MTNFPRYPTGSGFDVYSPPQNALANALAGYSVPQFTMGANPSHLNALARNAGLGGLGGLGAARGAPGGAGQFPRSVPVPNFNPFPQDRIERAPIAPGTETLDFDAMNGNEHPLSRDWYLNMMRLPSMPMRRF